MRIDVNAYLGHHPFQRLRHNTPETLLRMMDKYAIDKACVVNLNAVFYKNCHNGNKELAKAISSFKDRLIPFCVINPFYPGYEDDLKESLESFGAKAIAIFPPLHNYTLMDERLKNLLRKCQQKKLPVVLTEQFEDERQEHWLYKIPNVNTNDLKKMIEENKEVKFVIRDASDCLQKDKPNSDNCFFDSSRLPLAMDESSLERLIKMSDKLLFGTRIPMKSPLSAIMRVDESGFISTVRNKIYSENIMRIM